MYLLLTLQMTAKTKSVSACGLIYITPNEALPSYLLYIRTNICMLLSFKLIFHINSAYHIQLNEFFMRQKSGSVKFIVNFMNEAVFTESNDDHVHAWSTTVSIHSNLLYFSRIQICSDYRLFEWNTSWKCLIYQIICRMFRVQKPLAKHKQITQFTLLFPWRQCK